MRITFRIDITIPVCVQFNFSFYYTVEWNMSRFYFGIQSLFKWIEGNEFKAKTELLIIMFMMVKYALMSLCAYVSLCT